MGSGNQMEGGSRIAKLQILLEDFSHEACRPIETTFGNPHISEAAISEHVEAVLQMVEANLEPRRLAEIAQEAGYRSVQSKEDIPDIDAVTQAIMSGVEKVVTGWVRRGGIDHYDLDILMAYIPANFAYEARDILDEQLKLRL